MSATGKGRTMAVEFTDRYGGRAPSWLRACHGDCEAMGYVPVPFYPLSVFGPPAEDELRIVVDDLDPRDITAWGEAHDKAGAHECDGWHFIKCRECGGTGRVSLLVTVARIPRWIIKGLRFYRWAMTPTVSPDGWTWRMRFRNYLNAAFLSDLRSLRR